MFAQQPYNRAPDLSDADIRGAWLNAGVRGSNLGVDYSAAGDDMTPVNPTDITAERVGATFGGTNGYLRRAEADWRSGDSVGTIFAWIKPDATASGCIWASSDEATTSRLLTLELRNNLIAVIHQDGTVPHNEVRGSTTIAAGRWQRVAVVSNGSQWSLYVNGQVETPAVVLGVNNGNWLSDAPARDNVTIGVAHALGLFRHFNGQIKDVRYYSRIFSVNKILYDYQLGVPDDDLVLWLPWGDRDYTRFEWPLTFGGGVTFGHRMLFDGTDDYIDAGDIGLISQVSMWIRPASITQEIFQIDAGKHVVVNAGTVTYAGLTEVATYVDAVATTTLAADVWQHLVCQFTQDDALNFELGREGANYGQIDLWNVRAHDRLWNAAEVTTVHARERRAR